MKYYRVTAYTMYCGEETTDYIATSDEEKLRSFGLNLAEENALEWEPCWVDYEEQGYDSEEDWQEEYFGSANFRFEEITEEELLRRDKLRIEDCRMNERCLVLLNNFKKQGFDNSLIIDSTNLTIDETVNKVIGG